MGWGVRVVEFLVGLLVVVVFAFDVFQSVVLPRPTPVSYRPSAGLVWALYGACRSIALRASDAKREQLLGTFAPFSVVALLLCWMAGLIVGYGLMLHSMADQIKPPVDRLGSALYLASASMLTIGFGDIVPIAGLPRFISVMAGATGLGLVAVVITFLFTLFGEFQRREILVIKLSARAGAPPSGVNLLETYALYGMLDRLGDVFADWETWSAEVLDSHLSYPILAFFRSTHDNQSWISALGAVLDASTLVLTTVEGVPRGPAKLAHAVGVHLVEDLGQYFGLTDGKEAYVERDEFTAARERLAASGFQLRDCEESWANFTRLRAEYAGVLNAMARRWMTPPALWIGDRSVIRHHGPAHT